MAEREPIRHDKAADQASAFLRALLRDYPARDFAIELWDGTRWDADPSTFCRFTWHINDPQALTAKAAPTGEREPLFPAHFARGGL